MPAALESKDLAGVVEAFAVVGPRNLSDLARNSGVPRGTYRYIGERLIGFFTKSWLGHNSPVESSDQCRLLKNRAQPLSRANGFSQGDFSPS